ncbi:hypothetical protein [Clavibacter tessellarius]|uniref:Uncharacterized protein n=1 Tax=Clavibacter tessellarius TaxID=31965 RepID=A0A154UY71_9MICO|nr:hypothetical protein [Clavibacter michiganensis]KZC94093.1 hypothetical protein AWH51_15000 [Clavibacter michiganensis subsp. tessellarius]
MHPRTSGHDDRGLRSMTTDELRRAVYAQGADESDERWIRAAAELTRREPASRAAEDADGADPASDAAEAAPPTRSRRALAWAGGALALGLLAGAGIAMGLGGSAAPGADTSATPSADASASASAEEPPDPARVRSLLGSDITRTSGGITVEEILARPQEQADRPPRSPGGDVDLTTIRGVQTSVGLYVARTISGDACLLVYPWSASRPGPDSSPGSGVASCAPPAQLAVSGLEVTWIADMPVRRFDGGVGMRGGGLTAVWAADGRLTLSSPDVPLAY